MAKARAKAVRVVRVPKRAQPIYDILSQAFRDGTIFAFNFDGKVWSTCDTRHDWDATTLSNGTRRCGCVGGCEYGPREWTTAELADHLGITLGVITKPQLIAELKAIDGLPDEALELLKAA